MNQDITKTLERIARYVTGQLQDIAGELESDLDDVADSYAPQQWWPVACDSTFHRKPNVHIAANPADGKLYWIELPPMPGASGE